ncbi:MAG TPA: hypothetical protein VE008_07250 [Burkholderiales bacterium]|nr:hypothetical protein [Burkholderiales bacterium]
MKPGIQEKMGVAVNATDLSSIEGREGAVERVAALAYTQTNPGAIEHAARELGEIDPGAELGALLIRIKAGNQYREADRAAGLLVHWIRKHPKYAHWKLRDGHGLLQSFARQSLAEWLWPVCAECKGVEAVGMERDRRENKRVKCRTCFGAGRVRRQTEKGTAFWRSCELCCGFGRMLREKIYNVKPRICPSCQGTGQRLIDDFERARVLRVSLAQYQRHWLKRFDWLRSRLDHLDWNENNLLTSALGRRTNPGP